MKYIENIAEKVRTAENRAAVHYAKPDGRLYKYLKISYITAMVITFTMTSMYIIGRLNMFAGNSQAMKNLVPTLITHGIILVSWLVSMILIKFKFDYISAVLTVIPGAVGIFDFKNLMTNVDYVSGIHSDFWIRHFIPLAVASFLIIWMAIINIRAKVRFGNAYKLMVARIYQQFSNDDINEEEWEEFLKNYDPRAELEKQRRKKKGEDKPYTPIVIEDEKENQ